MIYEKVREQLKDAMRAKDEVRLSVIRSILSAFTNDLVAKGKKPQDPMLDEDALAVIKRLSNQRKDSIEQFEKAGRGELAQREKDELAILQTYLPAQMEKSAIKEVAEKKKAELGITQKGDMGKLMGAVMKELKGTADGNDVKEVVEGLF